jgi:hypothetical protein
VNFIHPLAMSLPRDQEGGPGFRPIRQSRLWAAMDADPRKHEPMVSEQIASKVLRVASEGRMSSMTRKNVKLAVDSICVRSDIPDAIAIARAVHTPLAVYL